METFHARPLGPCIATRRDVVRGAMEIHSGCQAHCVEGVAWLTTDTEPFCSICCACTGKCNLLKQHYSSHLGGCNLGLGPRTTAHDPAGLTAPHSHWSDLSSIPQNIPPLSSPAPGRRLAASSLPQPIMKMISVAVALIAIVATSAPVTLAQNRKFFGCLCPDQSCAIAPVTVSAHRA